MNESKSIFERIKLYKWNYKRSKLYKDNRFCRIKKNNDFSSELVVKQSKVKIFFKFIIGFIASFFEYLVMKSNKKTKNNSNENYNKKVNENNKIIKNDFDKIETNKLENKNLTNINTFFYTIEEKKDIDIILNNQNNNQNNNQIETKTLLNKNSISQNDQMENNKSNLVQKKQQLILTEEKIIYGNDYNELEDAKNKILVIKQDLCNQKNNNVMMTQKLENEKNKNVKANEPIKNNYIKENTELKNFENSNITNLQNKQDYLIFQDNTLNNENVIEIQNKVETENNEIDKLVERCDEDLILVDEKKNYLEIQDNYEKQLETIDEDNKDFKITKKDLKQIKNSVNLILEQQKNNLEQLKKYMEMPYDSHLFMFKFNNFFKSTAKLSFSVVPFFTFPNRLIGLVTSALFFNNSLKSFRVKPNQNYINQNIRSMITNNEVCLKVGISSCEDSLKEINNIKYYLKNLPNEVKDTFEYRRYLVDVESVGVLVQKQIETMQKMSKKYNDIKIKIKTKEC